MAFNIETFKSNLGKVRGIAPTSKFEVYIWNKADSILSKMNANKELRFLAFSADIPGISFSPDLIMLNGYGRINEIPIRTIISDCVIEFYMDSNNHAYEFFHSWLNTVSNFNGADYKTSNFDLLNYPSEYYADVFINFKNNDGTDIFTTELIDAYPLELGGVNLDWNNENLLASSQVRIGFRAIKTKFFKTPNNI